MPDPTKTQAPTPPPETPKVPETPTPKAPQALPVDSKTAKFVKVDANPSGTEQHKYRGVCTKCGWQSYQPSADAANEVVRRHATKHLHE